MKTSHASKIKTTWRPYSRKALQVTERITHFGQNSKSLGCCLRLTFHLSSLKRSPLPKLPYVCIELDPIPGTKKILKIKCRLWFPQRFLLISKIPRLDIYECLYEGVANKCIYTVLKESFRLLICEGTLPCYSSFKRSSFPLQESFNRFL